MQLVKIAEDLEQMCIKAEQMVTSINDDVLLLIQNILDLLLNIKIN